MSELITEKHLHRDLLLTPQSVAKPVDNGVFVPCENALQAEAFHGKLLLRQTELYMMQTNTEPFSERCLEEQPSGNYKEGSGISIFPEITLELFTFDNNSRLSAAQTGTMVADDKTVADRKSYWHAIPQYGRVWKEPGDDGWSRAAFPVMLVNNGENVAHQGLALFLYKGEQISNLHIQLAHQSTPLNILEHFIAWAIVDTCKIDASLSDLQALQMSAMDEITGRLNIRPWSDFAGKYPDGALDGFGGPLDDQWIAFKAVVQDGTVYAQDVNTPFGLYPYPEEMRFGVRSVTKSIAAPLALSRLAQSFGPYVLNLKIGDYVTGLPVGYKDVRFIDAANMASGMGGAGPFKTRVHDGMSGHYDLAYNEWYNDAKSLKEKNRVLSANTSPYPWEPGVVYKYRDHDYFVLGAALDGFVKKMRGPDADIWTVICDEVLRPIGVYHAPIVKTTEADDSPGLPWFNAGIYPTIDDLAKIARLYQNLGVHEGEQILHRGVIAEIFSPTGALIKDHDHSLERVFPRAQKTPDQTGRKLYKMGFHYEPYTNRDGSHGHVPKMEGFKQNFMIFHPNDIVSIRLTKAWPLPEDQFNKTGPEDTIEIINNLVTDF